MGATVSLFVVCHLFALVLLFFFDDVLVLTQERPRVKSEMIARAIAVPVILSICSSQVLLRYH